MATTNVTLLDELKNILDDDSNKYMSDAEYNGFIFKHTEVEGTYGFNKMRTGLYVYQGRQWFENISFSEDTATAYTAYFTGSINVTTGVDPRDLISVTATTCNFPEVIVDICRYILSANALKGPTSIGGGFFAPANVEFIKRTLETWRGARRI